MKQIEVQIMGQNYRLGCPEGGEERLREAVQRVDAAMCRIRDAGKIRARDRIAVLAALNLAFEIDAVPAPASAPAVSTESLDAGDQGTLLQLLGRLDQALEADGQLI